MYQIRDKWINRFYSGQPIDKEKAKEKTEWLYEFSGLEKPKIVFLESPLACQLLANSLKENVGENVWGNVRENVEKTFWKNVRKTVVNTVDKTVDKTVWGNVGGNVWKTVVNTVGETVRETVINNVDKNKGLTYFAFSYYGSTSDYAWVSFYNFFEEIGVIHNKDFKNFRELIECNIYDMIQFENLCIVCALPEYVDRDDSNRMHSLDRSCIRWNDGYELYYIHGINFEYEEWNNFVTGKTKALDIITEANQDKKRAMALAYGNEKMVKELKAKEINRMKDEQGNTMRILLIEDKKDEDLLYYEAIDPSKNEKVYLRIPSEFKERTAIEAKLWTFKPLWEEYERTGIMPEFIYQT